MTTMAAERQKNPRGRPRPAETIERDRVVLDLLKDNPQGLSRNELAEMLGIGRQMMYLSLDRLRRDGKAENMSGDKPLKKNPDGTSQAAKDSVWKATE